MRTSANRSKSISEFLVWLYRERNFSLIGAFKNFAEKSDLMRLAMLISKKNCLNFKDWILFKIYVK